MVLETNPQTERARALYRSAILGERFLQEMDRNYEVAGAVGTRTVISRANLRPCEPREPCEPGTPRTMIVSTMRVADRWFGVPACFLLTAIRNLFGRRASAGV